MVSISIIVACDLKTGMNCVLIINVCVICFLHLWRSRSFVDILSVTNIFALLKCHTLDSWGTCVTSFFQLDYILTWCIIFIFPFSLTIHLYAKVDIEVYWLLRCVVRNIAWTYCLPIFKFNANSKIRVFSSNHCIKNITKDDLIFPHET